MLGAADCSTRAQMEALMQKLRLKLVFSALRQHVQLKQYSRRLALMVPNMRVCSHLCASMFMSG